MHYIKMLATAPVDGETKRPADGALFVSTTEAQRLIAANLAEDISTDFDAPAVPAQGDVEASEPAGKKEKAK